MAETIEVPPGGPAIKVTTTPKPKQDGPRAPTRFQQLNKLYALPAPIRTFPLPTLIPHNPLSLFHILYVWLSQTINRPSSHFDTLYHGWFSPETRSIHVTDSRSIRGLWEQGFYGKGSLSRSEPSWLIREKARRGVSKAVASEDVTKKRRAERQQTKWERARKEREAIDQTLLEEARAGDEPISKGEVQVDMDTELKVVPALPPLLEEQSEVEPELQAQVSPVLSESNSFSSKASTEGVPPKSSRLFMAPVGPMELLRLPNSDVEFNLSHIQHDAKSSLPISIIEQRVKPTSSTKVFSAPVGPVELLALPNSAADLRLRNEITNGYLTPEQSESDSYSDVEVPRKSFRGSNGHIKGEQSDSVVKKDALLNGAALLNAPTLRNRPVPLSPVSFDSIHNSVSDDDSLPGNSGSISSGKHRKSVRCSPTVEKNTFIQSEPPSPERAARSTEEEPREQPETAPEIIPEATPEAILDEVTVIEDQEHFQLTMEEAFFLAYGLGALTVLDPVTKSPISNQDLFCLFRKSSYFPPLSNPGSSTDDPFLISYVVYHHFRSLGWVVRGGTKFSVDYLLYNRGPVFSHAEFAVLILPSYSDPYWSSDPFLQNYVKGRQQRSWSWMHCINRVITQVKKTLILVYVDIPAPLDGKLEQEIGVDGLLGKYKVREVVLKRWSPNRSRD